MNDDTLFLPRSHRERLEKVYRKTEYQVPLNDRNLRFRIGEFDPAAEALLRMQLPIRKGWAILTPCNPRSQEATEEMNGFYYHELRDALAQRKGHCLQAINHDPTGIWPDEPGFILADAEPLWLHELAARFRQNAYVTAQLGKPPRLVWVI